MALSISIVIPTLNSSRTLRACLDSIKGQDYPKDSLEVLIPDGGSSDETLDIVMASGFSKLKIFSNPLKTGEAGKAVGAKAAANDIVAFIDSDNILPDSSWLKRMVEPFSDLEIIASEPIEYTYRRSDGYITRYCALMGMNDPLCLFLGNYDRYNYITDKWTGMPHFEEDKSSYIKIELDKDRLPTIGANGFFIRKACLAGLDIGDYLFDIDIIHDLINEKPLLRVAKVKTGIIHIFAGGVANFIFKQRRRIKDYAYFNKLGLRTYKWSGRRGLIKFTAYNLLLLPLMLQAIGGYLRKRDAAWFFHVTACILTFFIYAGSTIMNFFVSGPLSRDKWQR